MHAQEGSDEGYVSYMLRMWRRRDGQGKAMWCASLQEPGSRRTEKFEDANAMFAYLQRQLSIEEPAGHSQPYQEQQG